MYTIEQIEQVAVRIFASVTDIEDRPSQLRMKTITELFCGMLANKTTTIDEDALDEGTARLVAHFVTAGGAPASRASAEAMDLPR